MATALIDQVRKLGEEGRFTPEDVDLLEDVANGGNPGWEQWIGFMCAYLPAPVDLPKERVRPGLLADVGDLEVARERMERDVVNGAVWEMMEGICKGIMMPGSDTYIDVQGRLPKQVWGRRQGHWVLSNAIEHLSWAYRLSGERAYGEYAREILLAIAKTRHGWGPVACNWGTPYKGWLTDNTLDLGHATLPFAVGFDLVYDLLSEEDVREIADYYEPYFHRIAGLRYECVRQMPANTPIIGHCGVGLMALSLADVYPEERRGVLAEAVRSARAYAMAGLDGAIKEDGACVEGSGYSSASMHYLAVFSEGLRRVCGVNLFEHPTWKRNPQYLCLEMLPGGSAINNYNDNHYDGVTTGFWMFVSRNMGDQTGAWVWDHFSGPNGSGLFQRGGGGTVELPYLLLNRDPDTPVLEPEAMGISPVHLFDKIHHLVMRTGWAADDLHVTFQCTPYDPEVHAHAQADRLNVTMYGLGERLLIDSGYGLVPIEGSTQVKRMGKLGESHNQVRIDGVAQEATPVQEGNCKVDRWEQVGEWVWAVSDATAFYKGAQRVRRAVVTRLDKEAPLVLMADLVIPESGAHSFEWLLQTEEGNRYEVGEAGATLTGHRTGACVRIGQCANLPVEWEQDVWISHPRLIGASQGPYLVALTAIGKVDSLEADGLMLSWKDARGTGKAMVELVGMEDGVPGSVRLMVEPGGIVVEV